MEHPTREGRHGGPYPGSVFKNLVKNARREGEFL